MPIRYDRLFLLLKQRGKTEYRQRQNGIRPSILSKLKHQTGGLDARTIEKLCRLFDCQPGGHSRIRPGGRGRLTTPLFALNSRQTLKALICGDRRLF